MNLLLRLNKTCSLSLCLCFLFQLPTHPGGRLLVDSLQYVNVRLVLGSLKLDIVQCGLTSASYWVWLWIVPVEGLSGSWTIFPTLFLWDVLCLLTSMMQKINSSVTQSFWINDRSKWMFLRPWIFTVILWSLCNAAMARESWKVRIVFSRADRLLV